MSTSEELLDFVAWHPFVDDGDILTLARGLTSLMAVTITAYLGRPLCGPAWGLAAAGLLALSPLHVRFSHLATTNVPIVLWSSLAVLWVVRSVQRHSRRDLLILGHTDDDVAAQPHAHACLAVNGKLSGGLEHGRG